MNSFSFITNGLSHNPPILFIHGFMGDKEDWSTIISHLKNDYYCISIDLPGHGMTPLSKNTSFKNLVEDLAVFISNFLSKRRICVIGYSMGGRVALSLALNFPERFNSVVLESSSLGISNQQERAIRLQKDKKLLSAIKTKDQKEKFLKGWYRLPIFGDISSHPNFDKLFKSKLQGNFSSWNNAIAYFSVGAQEDYHKRIRDLEIPLLYISGSNDKKYQQIGNQVARLNNLIKHRSIENVAHNTHFEKEDAFTCEVLSFLSFLL